VNPVASQSLPRSVSVFRVSSRAVGVPALSSRLLRLPGVFSSTLSGACQIEAVWLVLGMRGDVSR